MAKVTTDEMDARLKNGFDLLKDEIKSHAVKVKEETSDFFH